MKALIVKVSFASLLFKEKKRKVTQKTYKLTLGFAESVKSARPMPSLSI